MPKPSREPRGRKNEWESLPESKSEVESYLNNRKETPKQTEQKYVWSYLPESLQEIEDRRQKQYQDLQAQRANIIPTATGNMDAEYAGYNKALAEYGAYWGDKGAYNEGFAGYNAAMDRVRGQYDSHEARHAESDRKVEERIARTSGMQGAGNRMADADRRSIRDKALYNRMAKDANTAGDYALYQRAARGYNKTVSDYATNYSQAQSDYWDAAKTEQPGYYYANTMSADEVDQKLEELNAIRSDVHRNAVSYGDAFNVAVDEHDVEKIERLKGINARVNERLNDLDTEIAYYEAAQKMQKQQRGNETYNYWLNEGGLEQPENWAKVEQGKAKYEADRLAASGGMKEPEIATPAGGAIKAYRDRNQKENEWDSIFDNAPNLTPSDEMVFYALYADDPEQAMEWAYYINNRRNSEFQGEMAAWGKEHPIPAWFGGLGNRMISGAANIVDPNSAFAQKQSLQSTGLLSGGAQALNEWSGTIDTDIPIIKDLFNGKGAGDFYQLASSIVESGINMAVASYTGDAAKLVGALGTFIMGSSAAAADYNESLQRGLTTAQAQRHALAAGINEAAFEFISLDKVIKADKLAGQLKKVFVDAGIEASEEFCTTVANRIADGYLARQDGYDTQVEQRTKELIALGLSRAEAEAQAEREWRVELINDAIGGFISGGFHAGIEWGGGKVANKIATNQYNETAGIMTDADEIAALQAYANEHGIKYNEKALRRMEAVETEESGRQSAVPTTHDGGQQTTVSTETRDADSSSTAQNDNGETTEKKQSWREARQDRKSNRATGALQTQVEAHIAKAAHESGLNNAQEFFDQTVSRYGEGIKRTAQNAVAHEARSVFGQASRQAELTDLYQKALEGVTDQDIRRVVSSAYDQATVELAVKTKNTDALGRYYQQIRGTGTGSMTMEAIVKGQDGQETRSAITGMSEDGKSVTLADGSTVAVKDLQADADTMDIIHEISALGLGKNTDKVFQAYKKSGETGLDGYRWIMDYTTAIDQGRNRRISLQEAVKRSSLDAETVMEAYEMGHKETMDETRKAVQKNENRPKRKGVTGRVANIDTSAIQNEPMSKQEREQFDLANQIFELLGVDVKWEASKTKNGKYVGANGSYLNGAVTLDIHAGRNDVIRDINSGILATTGHELTHFLQEYAPEQYQALKEFVLQQIVKNGKYGEATLERMIQDKQRRHQAAKSADSSPSAQNDRSERLSRRRAEDEVVADACQTMLRDSKALQEFAEQKPGAAKGVIRWLADWFKKIKAAFSRSAQLSEQARVMEKLEKDVREAFGKLWDDALREAVQVHDEIGNMESGDNAQNSDRDYDNTGRELSEGQQEYFKDSRARDLRGRLLVLYHQTDNDFTIFDPRHEGAGTRDQQTPFGIFLKSSDRDIGVKGKKQMALYANITKPLVALNRENLESKLRDMFPEYEKLSDQHKALDQEYKQKHEQAKQAFTEYIAAWRKKHPNAGRSEIYQDADFDRLWNAEDNVIEEWEQKARELETETKEVLTNALEAAGYDGIFLGNDTGSWGRSTDAYIALHPEQVKNVNNLNPTENPDIRYSDRDTEYLELAKDPEKNAARLQEMVDEAAKAAGAKTFKNGKVRHYYHGTTKAFTSFAYEKARRGNQGYGFYFAAMPHFAERYGNTIDAYILTDNLATSDDRNVTPDQVMKIVDKYGLDIDVGMGISGDVKEWIDDYKSGRYDKEHDPRGDVGILKDLQQFITEQTSAKAEDILKDFRSVFGYDGLQVGWETVLWDNGMMKKADPVTYDDSGNVIPLSERFNPEQEDIRYSERDYDTTSDFDLLLNAAEEISDGGGDEYWASLLESDPGIAGEAEEIKRLGKQLKKTEADLAEARRNLTLTDQKLKTRGIASLAATIMQDQKAGDVNHNDVQKRITAVLTEAYQKALDQLDAGADVSDAWETVYQEGVVKAADILLRNATYSKKISYKWYTKTLGEYLGEGAREYVEADIAARVAKDFDANRYRPGQKGTVADRLVAQAENRVNKKLDAAKTENAALKAENAKLSEDKAFYKEQAETAKATAGELYQQLLDKREELKNNKKISADERKATMKKLDNMTRQMQAKRREAEVWKSKSEIGWKAANKAVQEKQAAVDKLEKQLQREQDILSGKLKPPAIQKMLKAAREREAERVAQQKDERFAKYKEGKKASDLRKRIKNLSDDMKRTMVKPTDGSYVPASLYGSMTKLADALDDFLAPNDGTKAASRYRAVMDKIHALSSEYQAVATLDDPVYSSEYDEEIQHEINELVRTLQGVNADEVGTINMTPAKARELSVDELQKVYDIMKYINYCMKTAKSMMASGTFRSVYDAMGQIAEQQQSMTSLNRLGWYSNKKRLRMLDSLSVMRAVEMMSGWERSAALYQLMQQIENGVDVSNAWVMEYNKALQTLKTGKNEKAYRDALTKKLDYSVTDEEGLPVLMTKMQALQLLMTAEREAHNDKLVHLQKGGATVRDALAIQDGKKNVKSQNIKVTPELIQRIQDSLSDWDKAYMKTVRDYFKREGKTTNSVMYKLKHRVLQTEEYYTPYVVDKNYLDTNLDEKQAMSMWAKVPGSTNALETKASQPVIIDGMDTVMAKHVREIADYIGLALPIRDFSKVYNGRLKQGENEKPLPVKQTIGKNFGEKGQHLLTQSIIDVQGGSRSAGWSTAIAEHLNALQSAFVKSALLVNPSVTIKQAASYVAAGSILSHTALDRANHPISVKTDESHAFDPATGLIGHIFFAPNGATATRIYNEIDKHTSLHYQRRLGMSQAELANEANRSGKVRRAMNSVGASMEQNVFGHAARKVGASLNPVSWIQRMDVATTATLWLACKEQTRMDGMKVGTEEYWNHVTELYERVIRETQPMYDSLHRNAGQKSRENSLMQYLFPFRTVPIQNHGQIAASYETLQTALKSKDEARIKEAKKFFAKTMWAQTESAVIFSLMSFIAAALKRKTKKYRDEDEEISLESVLRGIGSDTAGTMFSNFFPLFGSAIWDSAGNIYDSIKTGKKVWSYDSYSVGVVDLMNEFAKASESLVTDAANMIVGKDVGWDKLSGDILGMMEKGLKCIGVPASTIKTYTEGFAGNLQDLKEGRIPALNDANWERSAALNANRYLKAWIADDDAKLETVKAEMMGNYAEAGKNEEEANKALKSKLTATAKDAFSSGTLDKADAILFLVDTGYYDEDKAWLKVKEWKAENEHADDDDYSWSKYEDLYAAMDSDGDIEPYRDELIDHGVKSDTIKNAVVDHVKERYEAGEVDAEEAMRLLQKYKGMSENDAYWKVDAWDAKEEAEANGEKTTNSNYRDLYAAIDANADASAAINELTAHGYKERDVYSAAKDHLVERFEKGEINETQFKNQLSRYAKIVKQEDVDPIVNNAKCYKETDYRLGSLNESYLDGEITAEKFKQIRVKYGGKTAEEAKKQIRWLDLKKANPNLEITESVSNNWYDGTTKSRENGHESAKAAGMSIEAYLKAKATLDAIKDSNDNGTGEDEVIAAIAKMNLTARQKDALYYERYKGGARKAIYKTW